MEFTIISSLFVIFLIKSGASDPQLYLCNSFNRQEITFLCSTASNLRKNHYTQECHAIFKKSEYFVPNLRIATTFVCDTGEDDAKTFVFYKKILKAYPILNVLKIDHLDIKHIVADEIKWISETITIFDAAHNHLRSIPNSISMIKLVEINLSFNKFSSLTLDDFMSAFGLIEINLGNNRIVTFQKGLFSNFQQLQRLNLNHNHIEIIESQQFQNNKMLNYLDISSNRLHFIAGEFNECAFLTFLYLDSNDLTTIGNITPEKCPKLEVLSISRNKFTCKYLSEYQKQWTRNNFQFRLTECRKIPQRTHFGSTTLKITRITNAT